MNARYSQWILIGKLFLRRDIPRKFLALLLAVLLYFCVTISEDVPRTIPNVNVTLELPPDVVCDQGTAIPVELKVSGPSRILDQLTPESFECRVPVSVGTVKSGMTHEITLSTERFRGPFGVNIKEVKPEKIRLSLDQLITSTLPIRQVFNSEDLLPAGYKISRVSVRPGEVTVTGPSALVNELRQVRTVPVPIDGTTREGFDFVAELQKLDGVSISPERVTMHVEIGRKASGERSLSGLPYSLLLPPGQREMLIAEPAPGAPQTAEVVVRGPDGKRNALRPNWILLFADLSELRAPGEYLLPLSGVFVNPDAARELEIIRILPEKLRVIVRPRDVSASRK